MFVDINQIGSHEVCYSREKVFWRQNGEEGGVMTEIVETGGSQTPKGKAPIDEDQMLDQLLTLTDGAYKRVAYDAYNTQYSVGRGYLWVASLLFAADFAIFMAVPGEAATWKKTITLGFIGFSAFWAYLAFAKLTTLAFGTKKTEAFSDSASVFEWELTEDTAKEKKLGFIENLNTEIKAEMNEVERRGKILRQAGIDLQVSITLLVLAVIAYFCFFW